MRRQSSSTLAAVVLLFWVILCAVPRESFAQTNDVALPETLKLSRLVDVAAEVSGQGYSYNPADLDATVTIRVPGGFTREQIPALLSHVLASRGYTTVRTPGSPLLSVVKLEQASGLATSADVPGVGEAAFITQVFEARHLSAKALADAARNLLSKPGGTANVIGDSNLVAISDLVARVGEVRTLVARLDRPDGTTIREVPLRYLSAQQAVASIAQIVAKRESAGGRRLAGDVVAGSDGQSLLLVCTPEHEETWRGLIAAVDRREPIETRTYSPLHFPARDVAKLAESAAVAGTAPTGDDRFRVVVDDLTGGLLVTGTASQHERVAALVERLDATPTAARRPVRTFVIKNRPVSEIRAILDELARAGALQAGTEPSSAAVPGSPAGAGIAPIQLPPPPAVGSAPQTGSPPSTSQLTRRVAPVLAGGEPSLSLTIDEGTNTLIAVGEPRLLSQIESLLRTLDVRQPQVMLEVLMVTLTDSQSRDLGVELEKLRISDDLFIRLSSLFGLGVRNAAGDRSAGDASGFTGVVLSPGDFSVVIRALESLNKGRSASMPKLLVGNNQQASLDSVVQQPYASVNATNTISTTSFGGTQDAGTVVTIRPQIAEGDHLVLEYSVSLSAFLGAATSPTLPPAKQQNRVQSAATIPDGSTVVVGGIDLESESTTTSQVPLLGDIPLLGEAFKNRNTSNSRSRFFVFIRANVLRGRGFEDLRYLSTHDMEAARVPDGWPEVEPRIIR